jgi:hypothetical protein
VSNNLVFRYNVEHTQDGLVGEEGTFSICTFWVSWLSLPIRICCWMCVRSLNSLLVVELWC